MDAEANYEILISILNYVF